MGKIAIVCFGNLVGAPYVKSYTHVLKKINRSFDVIAWDRRGMDETIDCDDFHCYRNPLDVNANKLVKLVKMMGYSRFVRKKLDENEYSHIIVLTSLLGVLLESYLVKKYDNRYIFDIRDHSYERFKFYYRKMQMVMSHSVMNVISSNGFKAFLPKEETILCHNCTIESLKQNLNIKKENDDGKIHIAYIGEVRYANAYKDFLLKIASEPRIEFTFYGFGEDEQELIGFCNEHNIKNISFYGEYRPEEKDTFSANTDIIFNVYGTDTHVRFLTSNRYYDALKYCKPILVSPGTTMEEVSAGICYAVDEKFQVQDFIRWYLTLDLDKVRIVCEEKLQSIVQECELFDSKLEDILVNEQEG